jgi:hypothetical protein
LQHQLLLPQSKKKKILSGVDAGVGSGVGEGAGEEVLALGLGVVAGVSAVGPGVGDDVSKIKSASQLNSEFSARYPTST